MTAVVVKLCKALVVLAVLAEVATEGQEQDYIPTRLDQYLSATESIGPIEHPDM